MTSRMNKIVSREVKVDLPSKRRKDSSKGLKTEGIVSGYDCVI